MQGYVTSLYLIATEQSVRGSGAPEMRHPSVLERNNDRKVLFTDLNPRQFHLHLQATALAVAIWFVGGYSSVLPVSDCLLMDDRQ
jgi:hypothetical protein